jgi:hypothetical protein
MRAPKSSPYPYMNATSGMTTEEVHNTITPVSPETATN